MPRVRINVYDIDAITKLEEQEKWEEQIESYSNGQRRESRTSGELRDRREFRFGGSEARDRKRDERRKESVRFSRRLQKR